MALIDVIKYEDPTRELLAYKWPDTELRLGTQLIVGEGQQALFVKGGTALDALGPGTHTLSSENLPLLEKLINLPFGGDSPFSSEVWFVSSVIRRDIRWGTATPIQILDQELNLPVSLRAFGRYGLRITDPRLFVGQLVGNSSEYSINQLKENLGGEIVQNLKDHLAEMVGSGISSLKIGAHLNEVSEAVHGHLVPKFMNYGVEMTNLNVESINIPAEELERISLVMLKSFEARELSSTPVNRNYQSIKTFEILKEAAGNQADSGMGALLGAGLGIGAGLPIGKQLGGIVTDGETQPDSSVAAKLRTLRELRDEGLLSDAEYSEKRDKLIGSL